MNLDALLILKISTSVRRKSVRNYTLHVRKYICCYNNNK